MPTVDGQSVISRWGRKGNPDRRSRSDRDGLAGKEILKGSGAAPSELVARVRSQPSCALRCDRRVIDRRNVRRGDVESAPVISAPASPDPAGSLSRGRVRKPDASDPVVVAGPVGQAHSLPGMTVGTPGAVLDQAVANGSGPDRRHPLPPRCPTGLAADRIRCSESSTFIRVPVGPLGRFATCSLDDLSRSRGYSSRFGSGAGRSGGEALGPAALRHQYQQRRGFAQNAHNSDLVHRGQRRRQPGAGGVTCHPLHYRRTSPTGHTSPCRTRARGR